MPGPFDFLHYLPGYTASAKSFDRKVAGKLLPEDWHGLVQMASMAMPGMRGRMAPTNATTSKMLIEDFSDMPGMRTRPFGDPPTSAPPAANAREAPMSVVPMQPNEQWFMQGKAMDFMEAQRRLEIMAKWRDFNRKQ